MEIIETGIKGLLVLKPKIFHDARGFFLESWRDEWKSLLNLKKGFIQDNHAGSVKKGVLRGLHFQAPPHAQTKLVWASKGAAYDVAVDLRKGSPTFGKWHSLVLSPENAFRFLIPRGFAHGYMTLEDDTEIQYKVDNYYNKESEGGLLWNDPDLDIHWPDFEPFLNEKDQILPTLANLSTPFK